MAKYNRYPSDEKFNERGVGIALPLNRSAYGRLYNSHYSSGSRVQSAVFSKTYTTEDQAIYNLINLLLTRKGERIMQPLFGSKIPDFVFEQNTELSRIDLGSSIRSDIEYWLPYIIVGNLEVTSPTDVSTPGDPYHAINISIPFKVTESGANINITFNLNESNFDVQIRR